MVKGKKKLKVVQIISDSGVRDRQVFYECLAIALKNDCDLHFIILAGNSDFQAFLRRERIEFTFLNFHPKSVSDIVRKAWSLSKILKKYDVVHTHYHDANFIGLLSGFFARVKVRLYTRHHNTFFHDINDRRSIFIGRIFNFLAVNIIAPSISVQDTLCNLEHVGKEKVKLIHHPFDKKIMGETNSDTITKLRTKYGINPAHIVIGAVSSFQQIKGTEFIIKAFKQITDEYENLQLILANAHGKDAEKIFNLIVELNLQNVICIPYENDVSSLYNSFDILVHAPVEQSSEAFGQVYTEAMGFGIPSIFTAAGVLPEIAVHGSNCLVVDFKSDEEIANAVKRLLKDDQLRKTIGAEAQKTIKEMMGIDVFRHKLLSLHMNLNRMKPNDDK